MPKEIMSYLPPEVGRALTELPKAKWQALEEIRLRMGREVTILWGGVEEPLSLANPLVTTADMMVYTLNMASGYSPYANEAAFHQGFLPLPGGHRLGICGTMVTTKGQVTALKDLSSLNLRIARQRFGCGRMLYEHLKNSRENLLIFGAPACGKTTLLRDTIRQLSNSGQRVGLVDSRGEVASCLEGAPQMDVGSHTDVLSMGEKSTSMEMLLRVMNPQWIAVDEITAATDVLSMVQASYCGVHLLATAHGFSREDLMQRPLYRQMMEAKIFQTIALVDRAKQVTLEEMNR